MGWLPEVHFPLSGPKTDPPRMQWRNWIHGGSKIGSPNDPGPRGSSAAARFNPMHIRNESGGISPAAPPGQPRSLRPPTSWAEVLSKCLAFVCGHVQGFDSKQAEAARKSSCGPAPRPRLSGRRARERALSPRAGRGSWPGPRPGGRDSTRPPFGFRRPSRQRSYRR